MDQGISKEKFSVQNSSSFLAHLRAEKALSQDQSYILLLEKRKTGMSLELLLMILGFMEEKEILKHLSFYSGLPILCDLKKTRDKTLTKKISEILLERHQILPYQETDEGLVVAMADPYDIEALDSLKPFFSHISHFIPQIASPLEISQIISHMIFQKKWALYEDSSSSEDVLQISLKEKHPLPFGEEFSASHFIETLIFQALNHRASDIHFFPRPCFTEIMMRVDGVLRSFKLLPLHLWTLVCGALKMMSDMNISEFRHPQSGRFPLSVGLHKIDCRVSSHPTKEGESFVIRLLDQTTPLRTLGELGYTPSLHHLVQEALQKQAGLIIVAGPTGSGKTTTLYAMVESLRSSLMNIMTLEDPIEYTLSHVRQSQVGETGILSFSAGIRSLLRQDPDILLIGEIRDEETAQMALRASMTGHPILTTVHSLTITGVIRRLIDLGVSFSQLTGQVTAILAQRLVRRLCLDCRKQGILSSRDADFLGVEDWEKTSVIFEAAGCEFCQNTGYKGRLALAEGILINQESDLLLAAGLPLFSQSQKDIGSTFCSFKEAARYHLLQGETSLEEIYRHLEFKT